MKIGKLINDSEKAFYSLEFFPPKNQDTLENFYDVVDKLQAIDPLFMSVTYGAGGSNQDGSLQVVTELNQRFSCEIMAHLTCIGATNAYIKEYVEKLQKVGVENILALRGDVPTGQEESFKEEQEKSNFKYASDLVHFVKKSFPSAGIAVAGYPAPHPESPSFASDWRYTVAKIREGADFVVTQMFFDVREYFSFVDRLSDMGVSTPIIPGILPVQSFDSLRRVLSMSGANIPGKLYLDMEEAYKTGGNQAVKEAGIKFAVKQIRTLIDNGAPGIHLYTLNQASTCLQIVEEVGAL